jgi:GntR family transcriptional regulator of arabinose operon
LNNYNPPKYIRIKQEILSWITELQYKPHDKLPSEHEIADRFGMSRQTVRQALGDLEQGGWLYRVQGKGTFVGDTAAADRKGAAPAVTIGLITTYISDYIFPTIVRGVESAARARGWRLLLASTDNEKEKERESLDSMLREPISGLIVEPTQSAAGNPNFNYFLALESQRIPYVMLNERYSDVDAPCLKMDDETGGYRAAEHLWKLGHRKIAGFFKTDDYQGVHRMRGFLRALREFGADMSGDFLVRYATEEKMTKPASALHDMLTKEPVERPTAIVCYNDQLAVQLLDVIRQQGINVPDELSIVGFDDSTLAVATEVKLTTFAHPKTEMGASAVAMLAGFIDGKAPRQTAKDIVYEPKLIVRSSTNPPPQNNA